jgi:hypothetical protein
MWSLGALLYLLITGQTLFNNDQEDNLNNEDLIRLSKWSDSALKDALAKVHDPKHGKNQPLGRDLLEKLLQPDAAKRPQAFDEVLRHPFFVGESPEELEEEITKLKTQLSRGMEHVMVELKQAKEDVAAAQQATGAAREEALALARVQELDAKMKQQAKEEAHAAKRKAEEEAAAAKQEVEHVMVELKQAKEDVAAAQQATGTAQAEALARVQELEANMKQQAEEHARKEDAASASTQEILENFLKINTRLEELQSTTQRVATTTERVEKEQKRQTQLLEAIDERTIKIEGISDQTYIQLRKTEQVLLRGMFEATEVTMPTSFLITPNKLEQPTGFEPLLQLTEDGAGIELGAGGEKVKEQLEEQIKKSKGWFDNLCNLGASLCEAVSGQGEGGLIVRAKQEVSDFVKDTLQDGPMYLYLIDEYTGNPVPPSEGDGGRYPIEITRPSENAVKLLPLMRAGLKVMSVVNGAALVGNMFALPIPHVPKAWQEQASAAVGKLDKKSSVAEFDALQQSVNASTEAEDGEDKKQAVRGSALREFERFLDEHDPDHTFANLNRLVTTDGQACWTKLTQRELVEAEEKRNQVCLRVLSPCRSRSNG